MSTKLKIFVAGASGYTGLRLLPVLKHQEVFAHLRHNSKNFEDKKQVLGSHGAKLVTQDLSETEAIAGSIKNFDVIVSLIGTTRAQFDKNTSYESVDYQANLDLIKIAKKAGIKRFILLSSVGADKPVGPYLKIKKKIEDELIASGLEYIILRPSFLAGKGRNAINVLLPAFWLGEIFAKEKALLYKPIDTEKLAQIIVKIIEQPNYKNRILEGRKLISPDFSGSSQS